MYFIAVYLVSDSSIRSFRFIDDRNMMKNMLIYAGILNRRKDEKYRTYIVNFTCFECWFCLLYPKIIVNKEGSSTFFQRFNFIILNYTPPSILTKNLSMSKMWNWRKKGGKGGKKGRGGWKSGRKEKQRVGNRAEGKIQIHQLLRSHLGIIKTDLYKFSNNDRSFQTKFF